MTTDDSKSLALFGQQTIRRVWHNDEWYYSIVDVLAVLTESSNPRNYWNMLKVRAKSEGFDEAMADIVPLKLKSADNRFRLTETANRATLLRIIQSIPSPRAEPFRLWLAQVGDERLEEIENPEAAIERVRELYRARARRSLDRGADSQRFGAQRTDRRMARSRCEGGRRICDPHE